MTRVPFQGRPGLYLAGAGLLALFVVLLRLAMDARGGLAAARAAAGDGRAADAVVLFGEAARSYFPGNPWSARAFEDLWQMAARARSAQDVELERRALATFRGAALATRSFYTPHAARTGEAELRLAALMADWELRVRAAERNRREDKGAPSDTPPVRAALQGWHAERLATRPGPTIPRVLLALGGMATWIAGVLLFIRRGLGPGLELRRGPAVAAALVFVVGFTLFVVGLSG
jgi:hypothetical protein